MDLNQPGTTTKPVKMVSVAYVPGLSRNLLSSRRVGGNRLNRSSAKRRRL